MLGLRHSLLVPRPTRASMLRTYMRRFSETTSGVDGEPHVEAVTDWATKEFPTHNMNPHVATQVTSIPTLDTFAITERQEALLIEKLPLETTVADVIELMSRVTREDISEDDVLLMRSSLGRFTGRCAVVNRLVTAERLQAVLPRDVFCRALDAHDISLFVEQAERFHNLSADLRRLAVDSQGEVDRVVTLTGLPRTYGRIEVQEVLKEHADVEVDPRDIVFRFQRKGHQSDTVYVLCKSVKDSVRVMEKIQEIAVPKRRAYGEAFGCAFIWASRQAIFVPSTGDEMDIALMKSSGPDSRYNVFSAGWHEDVDNEQLEGLLHSLRFYPTAVHRVFQSDGTCAFILKFPSIKLAKCCINRLHRLKKRWRVSKNSSFYAHAQMIDIHWDDEDVYDDERQDIDSDIDEPIEY